MSNRMSGRLSIVAILAMLIIAYTAQALPPQYPFKAAFDVRAVSYTWGGQQCIGLNLINQDPRSFDSLQIRFYFNGTQEEMSLTGTPEDTVCQFGARIDIGILYRADGFQDSHIKPALDSQLRAVQPRRLAVQYDSVTKKYCWCYPLNLGGLSLATGGRLRIDLEWNMLSPYPPYTELMPQPPKHTPGAGDWSWGAKRRADGYPAEFAGILNLSKEDVDADLWGLEMNPYIAIFRGDSLLYGIPPDWKSNYAVPFDTIPRIRPKQDPMPYDPIAVPFDEFTDQLVRDSANLKISPIRVNQAGYRPGDGNFFYFVGSGSGFSVLNEAGASVGTGTLQPTAQTTSGQVKIRASNNAWLVSGGDTRYTLTSPVFSGTISEGRLPDLPQGHYKIVVDSAVSAPFVVQSDVYNMVKDALLKFYGVNRCGDSKSWFHPPCHVQDAVAGGWHDCGDHLKEGATMSYTAAVLGLAAAVFDDRDQDIYDADQSKTRVTDGIPDILYEAKHGAEFILKSYGGGDVGSMITSMGGFGNAGCGDDHSWWGRPEYQDQMPAARGGPPRCARNEPTTDYLAKYAANLAFVSKRFRQYDAAYADRCLKAAKAIYDYTKVKLDITNTSAYNGATIVTDDAAFGCLALLWATGERNYLDELCYDKAIGSKASANVKLFQGGWFAANDPVFSHTTANTDWSSVQSHVLWGFFRLVLSDTALCTKLNITGEERLSLIEKTVYNLVANLSSVGLGAQSIQLPDNGFWVPPIIKYDLPWFTMHTQMEWVWNRFQAGNITEMFYYYDIASRIQEIALPNTPATADWKADEVKTVLVRMMGYMLGINPWDICMISGIGYKNFNHPHHRAANPELRTSLMEYEYRHLVGSLSGGYKPTTSLYSESADDYMHTEVGIDGVTNILMPVCGLSMVDRRVSALAGRSISKVSSFDVRIVPSAIRGILTVNAASPIASVDVYSLAGRLVARHDCRLAPALTVSVKTGGSGIYLVRVKFEGNGYMTRKVTVAGR